MKILSIDIGKNNLGFTIAEFIPHKDFQPKEGKKKPVNPYSISDFKFKADLYDIEGGKIKADVVSKRVGGLYNFANENGLLDGSLEMVIIERQVPTNLIAMELMYSVVAMFWPFTKNVVIFDPKLKFEAIGQVYNTKNKAHKKQSILNMRILMDLFENDSFPELKKSLDDKKKQDDVADSFNQLMITLIQKGYIDMDPRDLYRAKSDEEYSDVKGYETEEISDEKPSKRSTRKYKSKPGISKQAFNDEISDF